MKNLLIFLKVTIYIGIVLYSIALLLGFIACVILGAGMSSEASGFMFLSIFMIIMNILIIKGGKRYLDYAKESESDSRTVLILLAGTALYIYVNYALLKASKFF